MKHRRFIVLGLLSSLVILMASPSAHAYSGYYYVIPNSARLRTCPSHDCDTLLTAYQGERVEILERTGMWSRVRFVDRSGIGWMPSDLLSYSPDLRTAPRSTYYVNKSSITIHDEPNPNSRVLTTLRFNEAVEMLGVGASGWAQVRDLRTNITGWTPPRYLSSEPLRYPKSSTRRRRAPARKKPPKEEPAEVPKAM